MGTTSPDGFVYADSSHQMNNWWDAFQELANSIQAARTAERAWTSWTPTWDTPGNGGFTSYGSGSSAEGFWRKDKGGVVDAWFRIRLGTSPATQSGTFVMNLPVTAWIWNSATEGTNAALGNWTLRDDSTSPVQHMAGAIGQWDSTGTKAFFGGAPVSSTPFQSIRRIDSTDPITWAAQDILSGLLRYRALVP